MAFSIEAVDIEKSQTIRFLAKFTFSTLKLSNIPLKLFDHYTHRNTKQTHTAFESEVSWFVSDVQVLRLLQIVETNISNLECVKQ